MRRRYFRSSRRKPRIADHLAPGRNVPDYHTTKLRNYDTFDDKENLVLKVALFATVIAFIVSLVYSGLVLANAPTEGWRAYDGEEKAILFLMNGILFPFVAFVHSLATMTFLHHFSRKWFLGDKITAYAKGVGLAFGLGIPAAFLLVFFVYYFFGLIAYGWVAEADPRGILGLALWAPIPAFALCLPIGFRYTYLVRNWV